MNEKLMQEKLKALSYKFGYALLGDSAGGLISTLLKRKGSLFDTLDCLAAAAKSGNARDYIGGVLRKAGQDLNKNVKIGDRMGNYEWDGGKWRLIGDKDGATTQA